MVNYIDKKEVIFDVTYREELVQRIKDVGQELIDRADEMISEDTELITSFYININNIDKPSELPTIDWTTEVVNRNISDRLKKKENNKRVKVGSKELK